MFNGESNGTKWRQTMRRAIVRGLMIAAFASGVGCAEREVVVVEPDPAQRLPPRVAPPTAVSPPVATDPGVVVAPVVRTAAPPSPSVANVEAPVPSPSVADAPRHPPNRARGDQPCGGPRRRVAPGERALVSMCGEHEGGTRVPDIFR